MIPAHHPTRRRTRGAGRLATIALLPAALVVALLIGEAALRALRPRVVGVARQPCIYEPDPVLGYRYAPGARGELYRMFEIDREVHINDDGLHDLTRPTTRNAGLRIAAVGDSFTATLYLDPAESWTHLLEDELRRRVHPNVEVWNLGLDGTGTDVHLDMLRHWVPRLQPDAVLLAFYANDFDELAHGRFARECYRDFVLAFQNEAQRQDQRSRADDAAARRNLRWLFDRSFLTRAVLYRIEGPRNPYRVNYLLPSAERVLGDRRTAGLRAPSPGEVFRDIADHAARHGYALFVVPVPAKRRLAGSAEVLRSRVPDPGAPVVDVSARIEAALAREGRPVQTLFFERDNHLNAAGNRAFAEALGAALTAPLSKLR
jgi:lysophospholipase L1-like esterase